MGPDDDSPIDQECVEAYIFSGRPPRLLVLRRPPDRGSIWVPVSGKVDPTDADFPSALAREVNEETGFHDVLRTIDLDWHFRFEGPTGGAWRLHAYGVEISSPTPPTLSREHDAFEWLSSEAAIARLHYPDNREAVSRLVQRLGGPGPAAPNL